MDFEMTHGERNLDCLRKSIPSGDRLYLWCYMPNGKLLTTDCPKADLFEKVLEDMGGLAKVLRRTNEKDPRPLLVGTAIGMQWATAYEVDDNGLPRLIFLAGPVLYRKLSVQEVYEGLKLYGQIGNNYTWQEDLVAELDHVPVMSYAIFSRYAVLMHNALNSAQLSIGDLDAGQVSEQTTEPAPGKKNRHNIWMAEKALLSMVRRGEIDYRDALQNSEDLSDGVPVRGTDPLRQAKTSAIVFTTLVCRAAMEGGLNPEIAYSLGDSYIQAVENSRDSAEISALALAMYDDFIQRVHRCHANPNYSKQIQKCCNYIELNLTKPIRAQDLGDLVGYTAYYLSEKFKAETGVSVSNYVRNVKIERAKVLLCTTEKSIADIAEHLAFNTVNYFIQSFKDVVGCTPAQYRRKESNENNSNENSKSKDINKYEKL